MYAHTHTHACTCMQALIYKLHWPTGRRQWVLAENWSENLGGKRCLNRFGSGVNGTNELYRLPLLWATEPEQKKNMHKKGDKHVQKEKMYEKYN